MTVFKYTTQAGDVRWRFRVDAPPDPATGERRRVGRAGFRTKREATAAQRELLATGDLDVLANREAREQTVSRFLHRWLDGYRARPTTLAGYLVSLTTHVIPAVGALRLRALTAEHLDSIYRDMEGRGYAPKTVRGVHVAVRRALRDAVDRGYVERNVADLAHPPRQSDTRNRARVEQAWSPQQLAAFLEATADRRDAWMWRLLGVVGLRRGEVLGLRWRDIDLDRGHLTVARIRTEAGGRVVEGPPKTAAGERTIALDARTLAALRRWHAEQSAERLKAGPLWHDSNEDALATQPDGQRTQPNTLNHRLRGLCARLDVPRLSPHGLRHTAATVALGAGVPVHVVSRRLGHSDPSITLRVYAHVLGGDDQAAADRIAAAIR